MTTLAPDRAEAQYTEGEGLVVRASSAFSCRRRLWYSASLPEMAQPESNVQRETQMDAGVALEGVVFRHLRRTGLETTEFRHRRAGRYLGIPSVEVAIGDGVKVQGTPDGKIRRKGEKWLPAEVKSRGGSLFDRVSGLGAVVAEPHTVAQLALYQRGLATIPHENVRPDSAGVIAYIDTDSRAVETQEIPHDQLSEMLQRVERRLVDGVLPYLGGDAPPDRDYDRDHWRCRNCPFRAPCWADEPEYAVAPGGPSEAQYAQAKETIAEMERAVRENEGIGKVLKKQWDAARNVTAEYMVAKGMEGDTHDGLTLTLRSRTTRGVDAAAVRKLLTVDQLEAVSSEKTTYHVQVKGE